MILFLVVALASCQGWAAEPDGTDPALRAPERRPLVILKQTVIHGRVFLIKEDDKQAYADNMKVEVQTLDGKKSVHKTKTNDDGSFALPSLSVGRYRLDVGRLRLELNVQDADRAVGQIQLPKTLLIFIPEEMRQ